MGTKNSQPDPDHVWIGGLVFNPPAWKCLDTKWCAMTLMSSLLSIPVFVNQFWLCLSSFHITWPIHTENSQDPTQPAGRCPVNPSFDHTFLPKLLQPTIQLWLMLLSYGQLQNSKLQTGPTLLSRSGRLHKMALLHKLIDIQNKTQSFTWIYCNNFSLHSKSIHGYILKICHWFLLSIFLSKYWHPEKPVIPGKAINQFCSYNIF